MAKKIIKVRLFTWFEEVDSPAQPGMKVLTERIAHFGEEVDITNAAYVKRGEDLDAFFSTADAKAIKAGTYKGPQAGLLAGTQQLATPTSTVEAADGEHGDVSSMDAPALGEYFAEQKLTIPQVTALIPEDADGDTLQKFEDAENIATNNAPRAGVIEEIDKRREKLDES